jgi:hypothetical protein
LKDKTSGQITVFLAITLLSVLMLAGLLVDLSRISAGKAVVKRAANSASMSVLAKYNSRLKQDYGIFAIPASSEDELNTCFEEYLAANLSIAFEDDSFKKGTDLFDFRIERVKITPILNLSENEVTKQQILEYMKYRAPAELADGFVERLSAVKDVGKMSEGYKKKVGIDKILGSMDKAQQRLKKSIDGILSSTSTVAGSFVTMFPLFLYDSPSILSSPTVSARFPIESISVPEAAGAIEASKYCISLGKDISPSPDITKSI